MPVRCSIPNTVSSSEMPGDHCEVNSCHVPVVFFHSPPMNKEKRGFFFFFSISRIIYLCNMHIIGYISYTVMSENEYNAQ